MSFYIKQERSAKYIHPESGNNPQNGTKLIVWAGALGERRIQFRFIPVEGEGHFGYIENVETGKIVHPACGLDTPVNGTGLNFHSARHRGALFAYDSLNKAIMHNQGKYWHPMSGSSYPNNGSIVHLWNGIHEGMRFKLVDESGEEIDPYPTQPDLIGDWKIINTVLDPIATHTYTFSCTTGKSQTESSTEQHGWSFSADVSVKWFSASSTYSGFVEKTNEDTWSEKKKIERSITIYPGKSVVTWQWVFSAEQYDDSFDFNSNIFTDTDSRDNKPPKPVASQKSDENKPKPKSYLEPVYIKHNQSHKYIHPESGPPQDGTILVLWDGALGERRIQFRFVPVEGEGHFGYLENVVTGRIVHPACSSDAPGNGTGTNFHIARHSGALFAYDASKDAIMHISGKYVHSATGNKFPGNGTKILLWDGLNVGSRFKFVDAFDQEVDIYPTPTLTGSWRMINCIINAAAEHTYKCSVTIGMSHSQSTTSHHEWSVSAEVSMGWFSASAEYSGYVENSAERTWSEEKTEERSIDVKPGLTAVTWQWVFGATQCNEFLQFKSDIIRDTDNLEVPPELES